MNRMLIMIIILAHTCNGQDDTVGNILDNGRYHERYSGKLDKAEAFYRQALRHEKADAATKTEARLGLAACAARNGEHDKAVKLLNGAYARQPEFLKKMLTERMPVGKPKPAELEKLESPLVNKVKRKLENIIIRKIEFDKVDLEKAFEFLKSESKKVDPAGEGVNFLLILNPIRTTAGLTDDGDDFDLGGDLGLDVPEVDPREEAPIGDDLETQKKQRLTVTARWDNIPLGDAVRYICEKLNLYCNVEEHAVVVAEQGALRTHPELRFLPIDSRDLQQYVNKGALDLKNPKPFFESMGVRFSSQGSIAYDDVSGQFIARDMPDVMRQIEKVVKLMQPNTKQVRISANMVQVDVAPKVLARVRPADLPIFILGLPENRRTTIATMAARTTNGKVLSVSQTGRHKAPKGGQHIVSSLSSQPTVRGDNLTIEGALEFSYRATPIDGDGNVVDKPLWETTVKQTVSVWDGEPIAVKVSTQGQVGKGSVFVIFKAVIIDPIGFPIRDQRGPKDGWLKVEGSNYLEY